MESHELWLCQTKWWRTYCEKPRTRSRRNFLLSTILFRRKQSPQRKVTHKSDNRRSWLWPWWWAQFYFTINATYQMHRNWHQRLIGVILQDKLSNKQNTRILPERCGIVLLVSWSPKRRCRCSYQHWVIALLFEFSIVLEKINIWFLRFVREVTKVLKKGGMFYITDFRGISEIK